MRYIQLDFDDILKPVASAPPVVVKAWILLLAWAANETTEDEHGFDAGCGGKIYNASITLKDEIERGALRITSDIANLILQGDNPPFWRWRDNYLSVGLYPYFSEMRYYRTKRLNTEKALKKWNKKK